MDEGRLQHGFSPAGNWQSCEKSKSAGTSYIFNLRLKQSTNLLEKKMFLEKRLDLRSL
jgi:hypothetical protein